MTTSPVMTLTDELLREFDSISEYDDDDNKPVAELRSVVGRLTAELRRLRAENAELAQSLAESRANDQAAMGWLTSLRWASGDRGERMLPELVSHIEGLAKDAGRWRYAAKQDSAGEVDICITQATWNIDGETYRILTGENADSLTDRAMAAQ